MSDEQLSQDTSAQPEAEEELEKGRDETAPPPQMRVEDAVLFAASLLSDLAWIHLGIRANPATGETQTDFAQARLAIDALNALVPVMEGRLDPASLRDMRNLVASLQLNFVQRQTPSS